MADDLRIVPAAVEDFPAIAALHAESWQQTYRGILPDSFLDRDAFDDRRQLWAERAAAPSPDLIVLKALEGDALCGFACALLDAHPTFGALLDNLHVRPSLKGRGIGARLLTAARERIRAARPGQPMHLIVFDANHAARRFYERQGGRPGEQFPTEILPGVVVFDWRYHWDQP